MKLYLTPSALAQRWAELRRGGRKSFIVRWGILRFGLVCVAGSLSMRFMSGEPLKFQHILSALITFAGIGTVWGLWAWSECESRSKIANRGE